MATALESTRSDFTFEHAVIGDPVNADITALYRNVYDRVLATQSFFLSEVQEYGKDIDANNTAGDAYFSDSWPKDIKAIRKQKGLPVGDVARFAPLADFVSGQERQQRAEEHVFSTADDTNMTADVLNMWIRYRRRTSSIPFMQSQVFQNAIVGNRWHVEMASVPAKDGTFRIEWYLRPYWEVFLRTPFQRYDAKDSPGLFHAQWVTRSWLESRYDGFDIPWEMLDWRKYSMITQHTTYRGDQYAMSLASGEPPDIAYPGVFFDETRNLIRMIRFWQKRWKNVFRVINPDPASATEKLILSTHKTKVAAERAALDALLGTGADITNVEINCENGKIVSAEMSPETRKILKGMVETYRREYYSYHVISGRVELEYEEDSGENLNWAHFFPYFVHGRYGGLFERVKDEAIFVNFMQNILIERMRKIGKIPTAIEEDALKIPLDEAVKKFEQEGFIPFKEGTLSRGAIREFQDRSLSSIPGYMNLIEHLQNSMERKIGADKVQQGIKPDASTSGKAIQLLQESGSSLIAPVFDNFKTFRKSCIENDINILINEFEVRPFRTAVKLLKIVRGVLDERKNDAQLQNFRDMFIDKDLLDDKLQRKFQLDKVTEILHTIKDSEYTCEIDDIQQSPSARLQVLNMAIRVAEMTGQPLPMNVAMSLSPLPQNVKDIWAEQQQTPQGAGIPGLENEVAPAIPQNEELPASVGQMQ